MYRLTNLIVITFLLISQIVVAQISTKDSLRNILNTDIPDIERVKVLHKLGGLLVNNVPDSALIHAKEAFAITLSMDNIELHSKSYRRMGHALYVNHDLEGLQESLKDYIEYATVTEQYDQVAASYRNLSKIGESKKQPDSSLYYLDKCLEVLTEHPDSVILVDVFLSKGLAYKYKGYYELSIEALLDGLRVAVAINSNKKMGYLHQLLGITYHMMGRDQKSAIHTEQSIEYFEKTNNKRGIVRSSGNLGIAYNTLDRKEDAIIILLKTIEMAPQAKMEDIAMHSHAELANIYLESTDIEKSKMHANEAQQIALNLNDNYTIGSMIRLKSLIAIKNNNKTLAKDYLKESIKYLDTYREPSENKSIKFEMAELFENIDNHQEALSFLKDAHETNDSIYTLKKEQQFAELNLIYETEKKNASIELLEKNAELDATRKRSLWGGLVLLALTGVSIIYALIQRKRKEKKLLTQEKKIEIEKRKNVEQELVFKKKELLAKILQLARKNEFLQSLEEEVTSLKSSVDQTVSSASTNISKMIHFEAIDEEEWRQFGKEFNSIHQDFIDRLRAQFGSFSNTEWRFISLLKMNLSSKDIANVLRITDGGIKKARYRLRKKLELESSVDLQDYLMGF